MCNIDDYQIKHIYSDPINKHHAKQAGNGPTAAPL